MIEIEEFLRKILPFAPGCPELVAMHHAREAAIEFCERTRLWRDEDSFEVSEDQPDMVAVPPNAVLFEIESITFEGRVLEPTSVSNLDKIDSDWRNLPTGQPLFAVQTEIDTIRIVPAGTGEVQVQTILRPSEDAEALPDFLAKHYRQAIADGALARILLLPGQIYSNPDMAMMYESKFVRAMDGLFNRSIKGQQRAPARTRPQFM